jgi:hypothetical protein
MAASTNFQREYWAGKLEAMVYWSDGPFDLRVAQALGELAAMIRRNEPAGWELRGFGPGRPGSARMVEKRDL